MAAVGLPRAPKFDGDKNECVDLCIVIIFCQSLGNLRLHLSSGTYQQQEKEEELGQIV